MIALCSLLAWLVLLAPIAPPPEFAALRSGYQGSEAQLLDRHGRLLHELRVDDRRRQLDWTELRDISPRLVDTLLYAEDRRFYRHGGVDLRALAGAAWNRLRGGPRRGASTVTMQLAAQLDPSLRSRTGARTFFQKWRQMRAAWRIEEHWSKTQILESWMNLIGFRGELFGVRAASRGLFGKDPHGITRREALLLAALLPQPGATPERVAERACRLSVMHQPAPRCDELRKLADASLGPAPRIRQSAADAPHLARRLLDRNAVVVQTTLDLELQRAAAESLANQLWQIRDREVDDGSVLVVDNRSGDILAWVGGSPFSATPYVDGVRSMRQAGSTLKPFLYALALERRLLTAASLLDDAPTNLPTAAGLYVPRNYDNTFRGLVSVRTALGSSLNVPAVRTLTLTGVDAFIEQLHAFGFAGISRDGDWYGPALALGSAEISLLEIVNAYRTLTNGGLLSDLRLRPDESPHPARRVLTEQAAFIVSDILSDAGARAAGFGLDSPLSPGIRAAVKTGTSKDMRDNWCIGFTRDYTVGVWVGNSDGRPMRDVSGVTGAAPVWAEIVRRLHRAGGTPDFEPPALLVRGAVRFEPEVESVREEWFLPGTEMAVVDARPTAARTRIARISYPGAEQLIALDPDIPSGRQRLFFAATQQDADQRWQLDGRAFDASGGWQPSAGTHRLELVDAGGAVVDRTQFYVRGAESPAVQ